MDAALPRYLTAFDVADWLHIPARRVERMARAGQIPCVRLPDGGLLFDAAVLAEWAKTLPGGEVARAS
jgi:hypothetical protein